MFFGFASTQPTGGYTSVAIDLVVEDAASLTTDETDLKTDLEEHHTVTAKNDSDGDNTTADTSADVLIFAEYLSGDAHRYSSTATNAVARIALAPLSALGDSGLKITDETAGNVNDAYNVDSPSSWPSQFSAYASLATSSAIDFTTTTSTNQNCTFTVSSLETGRDVLAYDAGATTEAFAFIVASGQTASDAGTLQCNCGVASMNVVSGHYSTTLTATDDFKTLLLDMIEWATQS